MADSTFGDKLASERVRRGLTLDQVSSTLRIRPAILLSLEAGDFHHMPLKGHARNMVSSYARYLGLDPTELTEQFLREYHDFEEGEAGSGSAYRRADKPLDYHTTPDTASHSQRSTAARRRNTSGTRSQGTRSMWNKPIPQTTQHEALEKRGDQTAATHSPQRRAASPASTRKQRQAGNSRRSQNASANGYTSAGRGYGSAGGYSAAKGSLPSRILGTIFKSPVTAIVSLVVVLILLIVLWALAANSCAQKTDELIPASGAAITENEALDPDTGLAIPDLSDDLLPDPRYGPFRLVIEPASGTTPWTEITVDGEEAFIGMLDERMSWEVTDYCLISTGQPGNLIITRNDTPVSLELDENGVGNIRLQVEERPASDRTTNTPAVGSAGSAGSASGANPAASPSSANSVD
jgi:hypothetical protein